MALESCRGLILRLAKDSVRPSFFIVVSDTKRTYYGNTLNYVYSLLHDELQTLEVSAYYLKPLIPLQLLTFNETETEE